MENPFNDLSYLIWTIGIGAVSTGIIAFIQRYFNSNIPAWSLIIVFFLGFISFPYINNWIQSEKFEMVLGKTFDNVTLDLDGKSYVNCVFTNTKFVFRGKREFQLMRNKFNNCYISYEDNAELTLSLVRYFYHSEGDNSGIKQWANSVLHSITAPDKLFFKVPNSDTLQEIK